MQASVFFSSKRSNTRRCAEMIASNLGQVDVFDIRQCNAEYLLSAEFPICGTPTYGMGEVEYSWITFLAKLPAGSVQDRYCGVFALGDQKKHALTFAGGLKGLTKELERVGFTPIGKCSIKDYLLGDSPALNEDGFFPGLVLDEINEASKSSKRIKQWLNQLG